jgi:LmbE family N-acetylglucosaminyl deacetylase
VLRLGLVQGGDDRPLRRVLAVGAHADDIEIGCGGTVLRLVEDYPDLEWWWVVLSAEGKRRQEAQASAEGFLGPAQQRTILLRDFKDSFFPYIGGELKTYFEALKSQVTPDLVLTPYRGDLHQDHRLVSELTWNTFRDHLILEYEIPKYDGDLGAPNVFVHLQESVCRRKVEYLVRHFPSQRSRSWFSEDLFLALLRLRGMESNSPSHYAEAFYGRKIVV